jgi:tetratricopeptide (TPR) repeat protein
MPVQPRTEKDPEPDSRGKRLESWKEIAGYLNRHVTTIRRWEKREGLPAHRHRHAKLGSIYAYTRELDVWFEGRRAESDDPGAATAAASTSSERLPPPLLLADGARDAVHLTGREEEIKRLRSSWERAARGQQQIAVVTGEPGVGKTRLVVEFARSIARHATVLVGRCDREALVGYAPWVTILQRMIRTTPSQTLRQHLSAIEAGNELAQIVPEIGTRIHIGAPGSATPDGHRYRLFEAASQLLAAASQGAPILLIIDDLHWADRGSLLLLRHLIRSTAHAAICIVVTHRNDVPEWSSEFRGLVESLRREHTPERIALHRLSDDDVRAMIEEWTGRDSPPSLTRLVARHTEGNPLFVVEMLTHLDETGALTLRQEEWQGPVTLADVGLPEGIRQLIGRRLERLGLTTRRLLTIGAVMGREFRLSDIEALVEAGEDAVLDAMDEALEAAIVTEDAGTPGTFSFTHTLVREALYTSITAARRVRLHHRIACALEQQPSSFESRMAELAYHFGQAAAYKSADKAAEYAARAGDYAATALAFENAAHWYRVALRAMDFIASGTEATAKRSELHVKRGRSFFAVGEWAAAKDAFESAVSLLGPAEHETRAELLVGLAEAAFWLMDVRALRQFAGEAQVLADRAGRDDLWADAHAWMASAMVSDGDIPAAIEMDREAIARAGGIRSFGLARTPLTLYWAGRSDEAIQHGMQAVETARTSEDPPFLLYALQHLGLSLSGAGRFDDALWVFDEARAFGTRCGALPLLARATVDVCGAAVESWRSRWRDGASLRGAGARASRRLRTAAGQCGNRPAPHLRPTAGPRSRRQVAGRDCPGRAESRRLACVEMEPPGVAGASRAGVRPRCMEGSCSSGDVCH